MSEKLKESLSAIIDGEADEFELRRVLDEIDKNEVLRDTWERYHLIGSRLRGERIDTRAKLCQQVWDALDIEGADDVSAVMSEASSKDNAGSRVNPQVGRWTGFAVAATVAVAVVLGLNAFDSPVDEPTQVVVIIDEPAVDMPAVPFAREGTPLDVQRQNAWMVRHAQLKGMNQQGFTPFVKMAAYKRQ